MFGAASGHGVQKNVDARGCDLRRKVVVVFRPGILGWLTQRFESVGIAGVS